MKFEVNFSEKKSNKIVKTVIVEDDRNFAIVLKAKMAAISEGFRFDKRKHSTSFCEI